MKVEHVMAKRINPRLRPGTLLLGLMLVMSSACGLLAEVSATDIHIEASWARPGEAGENSAAYMLIRNEGNEADRLLSADSDIAEAVEVHESTGEHGMMRMREVEQIEIPAGENVVLEPGGYHIMLMGLAHDLQPGDEFSMQLSFENAGTITIDIVVDG